MVFFSFKRTGRTEADEIGVCKNGKLIIRRSSFLTWGKSLIKKATSNYKGSHKIGN